LREPVNNQWLSPDLTRLAQGEQDRDPARKAAKPGPRSRPGRNDRQSAVLHRNNLHAEEQGHRRRRRGPIWQYLATLLLLFGSAAFSYVAWSEADSTWRQLAPGLLTAVQTSGAEQTRRDAVTDAPRSPVTTPSGIGAAAPVDPTMPELNASQAGRRAAVNALREQNRKLLHKLAVLQARLETPATD